MRDWRVLVGRRLAGLALERQERDEVIAELAAHLEETCEEALRRGMTEEEAVQRALSQAGNWRHLRRKILTAKRREQVMEKRIRQLWIPGFLTLILSMLFLATFRKFGFQPRLVGSGPSAVLFYMPWLLSLPFLGALGAYISSRADGSRGTMLLASVFPAIALTFAFLFMFPFSATVELITGRPVDFSHVATVLLKDGIGWIVLPAAALLLGGLLAQLVSSAHSSSRDAAIS
jgi:hypothetical protein